LIETQPALWQMTRAVFRGAGLGIGMLLSACAPLSPAADTPQAEVLCQQMAGSYTNEEQMQRLPATVARQPMRTGDWVDAQHARFTYLQRGAKGCALYLEWRSPNEDGKVSRRRIWQFEPLDGQVVMQFFSFRDEAAWGDQRLSAKQLGQMRQDMLVAYPPGCLVRFERTASDTWLGRLDAGTCRTIAQRSGKELALGALIQLRGKRLAYSEQGRYADGSTAFQVPGLDAYLFVQE